MFLTNLKWLSFGLVSGIPFDTVNFKPYPTLPKRKSAGSSFKSAGTPLFSGATKH